MNRESKSVERQIQWELKNEGQMIKIWTWWMNKQLIANMAFSIRNHQSRTTRETTSNVIHL